MMYTYKYISIYIYAAYVSSCIRTPPGYYIYMYNVYTFMLFMSVPVSVLLLDEVAVRAVPVVGLHRAGRVHREPACQELETIKGKNSNP